MKPCTCGAPATHMRWVLGEKDRRPCCARCAVRINGHIQRHIDQLESRRPVPINDDPTLFGEAS